MCDKVVQFYIYVYLFFYRFFSHLGFYKICCSGKYFKLKFPLKWLLLVKEDVCSTSSRGINVTWCVRGQTNELNSPCSPSSPNVGNKPDTTKMSVRSECLGEWSEHAIRSSWSVCHLSCLWTTMTLGIENRFLLT